ncbi:uncharacterized protein N7529_008835 [Penicillium soppii]|uniref:uncharacterized protein n=1 Tax=Penicillium soppii TaxID=69789 RepID=UPI002548A4A7|nr:uncharacterized protein N7529_008835 [Penicillium soppii]KAJ5861525.1 hypothetical protein N7529_008835 [Penicillium soppii]
MVVSPRSESQPNTRSNENGAPYTRVVNKISTVAQAYGEEFGARPRWWTPARRHQLREQGGLVTLAYSNLTKCQGGRFKLGARVVDMSEHARVAS